MDYLDFVGSEKMVVEINLDLGDDSEEDSFLVGGMIDSDYEQITNSIDVDLSFSFW